MEYLSLIGILAAVGVFIFMSMKRFSVYLAAIAATLVLAVFSAMNPYEALTGTFMGGMSGFLKNIFCCFSSPPSLARSWTRAAAPGELRSLWRP